MGHSVANVRIELAGRERARSFVDTGFMPPHGHDHRGCSADEPARERERWRFTRRVDGAVAASRMWPVVR